MSDLEPKEDLYGASLEEHLGSLSAEALRNLHGRCERVIERGIGLWLLLTLIVSITSSQQFSGPILLGWLGYLGFLIVWFVRPILAIRNVTKTKVSAQEHQKIYNRVCGTMPTLKDLALVGGVSLAFVMYVLYFPSVR